MKTKPNLLSGNRLWGAILFSIVPPLAANASTGGELVLKPAAEQSIFSHAVFSFVIAMCLLGLTGGSLFWWKKRNTPFIGSVSEDAPIIRATKRATQKTTLITVAWHGKIYLLAESQGSVSVVDSASVEATPS